MALSRWQPLREMMTLRDAMDRLFEENFMQPLSRTTEGLAPTLPLDMIERDQEIVVRASVPGYDPEQIDISVQGDTLTIRGSMEQEQHEEEEGRYHLREYRAGSFQRTVRLPVNVKTDQATADCKNGILTIHLPKAEEQATRRIQVQGTDQKQIESTVRPRENGQQESSSEQTQQ